MISPTHPHARWFSRVWTKRYGKFRNGFRDVFLSLSSRYFSLRTQVHTSVHQRKAPVDNHDPFATRRDFYQKKNLKRVCRMVVLHIMY